MKKLLFTLLLAAVTLPGWAGDKYPDALYAVGNSTSFDWGPKTNPANAPKLHKTSDKVYKGFVKFDEANGELKFLVTNSYNQGQWGAASQGVSINSTSATTVYESVGNGTSEHPDYKFKFNLDLGLYLVEVNLTTEGSETITFTKWNDSDNYTIDDATKLNIYVEGHNKVDASIKFTVSTNITAKNDIAYEINNASDLQRYSSLVKGGAGSLNGKLMADIDMNGVNDWTPIGQDQKDFKGHFDGQGYRIKNLTIDNTYNNQALFGQAIQPAIIENVIIDSSCSIKGQKWAAGILGHVWGDGVIIRNCGNEANITGTEDTCAGILGCSDDKIVHIYNCYNTGNITSPKWNAGICGWMGKTSSSIKNCYNIGTISGNEIDPLWRRNLDAGNATNNYTTLNYGNGTKISSEKVSSGELCFILNGDQTSINWYQNLSGTTDSHPVPFSSHSQVYASGSVRCDGTLQGNNSFSNNSGSSAILPHTFDNENGWCTVCNKGLNKTYLTADGEGYFSIDNAYNLNWFAAYVEEVNHGAKAKLTSDITSYSGAYIGNTEETSFSGIFDGQNHKITVSFGNEAKIGLFRCVKNGTIQNLIVDGTINAGGYHLMGGLVNESRESSVYRNIVVAVDMTSTHSGDGTHGGVISVAWGVPTLENVAFVGSINASNNNGSCGMIGYAHSGGSIHYKNCYVSGTLTLTGDNNRVFGRNGEYCDNCYTTLSMTKLNNAERFTGSDVTSNQVASGELCYLLNGSSCYGAKWFQNLTGDSYPVPFNTHGIVNKISSAGYTTQYIPTTDVTIPTGVKAYAGVISGDNLSLKEITGAISKDDAVILQGSEGYYSFVPTTGASKYTGNALSGSDGSVTGGANKYALAQPEGQEVGFYPVDNGVTIPAGKAYLVDGSLVKGFTFVFDDDATAIEMVNGQWSMVNDQPIFNLAGQRIQKMQKGINIVNGKKILF